jgi:phage gp46-like protein
MTSARLVALKGEALHDGNPNAKVVALKEEVAYDYPTPAARLVALKDEALFPYQTPEAVLVGLKQEVYYAATVHGRMVALKEEVLYSNFGHYVPPTPPPVKPNTYRPVIIPCLPAPRSRFRKFWTTQPDSCPPEDGQATCVSPDTGCARPGLQLILSYDPTWQMLSCGPNGGAATDCPPPIIGATIASNDYVRGLVLNILGTNGAQAKSICGNIPGQRLGYWLDDISGASSGTSIRYVPTKGYSVNQQVQFIQMQATVDMQKLIKYGVANSVTVTASYVGNNTVALVITVQGVDDTTTVVNSTVSKISNSWVWNT